MIVVSDTSPLRALQALDRLGLIESVFGEALIPPAVMRELAAESPGVAPLDVTQYPYLVVRSPSDRGQVDRLLVELNAGEAEALALAIEVGAETILLDESDGRRVAARLGLRTTGVLALLVRAKELRLLDRVAPLLDELDAKINFRVSQQVLRRVLADAGEL
ncbi:MAG: DUF3368 domain-containing protein [Phycisphaerales bacterium]|nr:DUF3368 domain-containing protein [Phycisphaerales bacterium]